jgi:hypothetical protein
LKPASSFCSAGTDLPKAESSKGGPLLGFSDLLTPLKLPQKTKTGRSAEKASPPIAEQRNSGGKSNKATARAGRFEEGIGAAGFFSGETNLIIAGMASPSAHLKQHFPTTATIRKKARLISKPDMESKYPIMSAREFKLFSRYYV